MDAEIFEQHVDSVTRFFRMSLRGDVEDLVHETILRMLEKPERIRAAENPRQYVIGIARNVLRNHLRKLSRDREFDPEIESMAALDPGPSTLAAHRRELRLLAEALRRVSTHHQTALQLYYWDKVPIYKIAEEFRISASAMRGRMMQARRLLKEQLAELEKTWPLSITTTRSVQQ